MDLLTPSLARLHVDGEEYCKLHISGVVERNG